MGEAHRLERLLACSPASVPGKMDDRPPPIQVIGRQNFSACKERGGLEERGGADSISEPRLTVPGSNHEPTPA